MQYAMMAIAGTPDGKEDFDPDMAAAYLRLISASTVTSGEEPEYVPQFTNAEEQQMATFSNKDSVLRLIRRKSCFGIRMYFCTASWQLAQSYAGIPLFLGCRALSGANLYGRYLAHGICSCLLLLRGYSDLPQADGKRRGSTGIVTRELPLFICL